MSQSSNSECNGALLFLAAGTALFVAAAFARQPAILGVGITFIGVGDALFNRVKAR